MGKKIDPAKAKQAQAKAQEALKSIAKAAEAFKKLVAHIDKTDK